MVISFDQGRHVLVNYGDVGLKGFDDICKETVFLYNVSLELLVD